MSLLAPTLQTFFTSYLVGQKAASAHTITAYRDTWRLLLTYLADHHLKPSALDFTDLTAETITGFLSYLEEERGNTASSRNARLAGIHALFHYAVFRHPEHADLISHVLAIAPKNSSKTQISYLTDNETDALLAAPSTTSWAGRRDQLIILTLITTGLRVSELTALTWADTQFHTPAYMSCHGKGRKNRITPLNPDLADMLKAWRQANSALEPDQPIFPAQGHTRPMSTDAVAQRLSVHAVTATEHCPTLAGKAVTPHILPYHGHEDACRRHRRCNHFALARSCFHRFDPGISPRRYEHQTTRTGTDSATNDHPRPIQTLR